MTAREVSYWECSSGRPPKLSGGVGVYRVIVGSCSLESFEIFLSPAASFVISMMRAEPLFCVCGTASGNTLPARTLNGKEKGRDRKNTARPDNRPPEAHLPAGSDQDQDD